MNNPKGTTLNNRNSKVTLVVVFGLWLGLVLGCSTGTEETREATNAITISAEDLYKAYDSNEADADKLYQGKILIVTGTVGTTELQIPAVNLVDAHTVIVQCRHFPTDQKDAISKLKTGQKVSVKGKCMGRPHLLGMTAGHVELQDCVLQ